MARQSSIITVEGKIGNIVGMKGSNGRSYARARVTPKNPKTQQQSIQRVIFGTAAKAYSALKSICDHSFEGIQYGAKSQQYFMKINLQLLRDFFAHNYPEYDSNLGLTETVAFFGKDESGYDLGTGLWVAKGSLPEIPFNVDGDGQFTTWGDTLQQSSTIDDVWGNNELQKGDQLTIVIVAAKNNSVPEVFKSRYVVKAEATDAEMELAWTADGSAAAFDADRTNVGMARLNATADGLVPAMSNGDYIILSSALIVSRKVGTTWERSNAKLINFTDESANNSPELALVEYMQGTTPIDTLNSKYLNNADLLGE